MMQTDETAIINKHYNFAHLFGADLTELYKNLPIVYAIPKLHKTPVKFRFIAGSKTSSLKPLGILLHTILVKMRQYFIISCRTFKFNNFGRGKYYSINGTNQLIHYLNKCRYINEHMTTANFSTLFTKLPHDTTYKCLKQFTRLIIQKFNATFLIWTGNNCYFSNNSSSNNTYNNITEPELCHLVYKVIHENYINFGVSFLIKLWAYLWVEMLARKLQISHLVS